MPVYVADLEVLRGRPTSVPSLPGLRSGDVEVLAAEGLETFLAWDDEGVTALTIPARREQPPGRFTVLQCSPAADGALPPHRHHERAQLYRQGADSVLTLGGTGCADLGLALRTAAALVASHSTPEVVLVTYDHEPGDRVLLGDLTVASDAATYCIVGTKRPTGSSFELLAIGLSSRLADGSVPARLAAAADRIAEATARALVSVGVGAGHVDYVLTNNYGETVREFVSESGGFRPHQFVPATQRGVGHVATGDLVLNLARLRAGQLPVTPPEPGQLISAILTSPQTCVTVILRAC